MRFNSNKHYYSNTSIKMYCSFACYVMVMLLFNFLFMLSLVDRESYGWGVGWDLGPGSHIYMYLQMSKSFHIFT